LADKIVPSCPHCDSPVKVKTMLDMSRAEFRKVLESKELEPPEFWGSPTDDRAIVRACMKDGWIHIKVNGQHRLAYLRGKPK